MRPEPLPAEHLLTTAATRIYGRYAREVVEAHRLCPWAREAREAGQVQVQVILGAHVSPDEVARHAATLADHGPTIIGLLVFPQLPHDPIAFQHFAAAVRHRLPDPWAIADFHPHGVKDLSAPQRAVAYIRRTPDPTLQLVRHGALAALRAGDPGQTEFVDPDTLDWDALQAMKPPPLPLADRVAEANHRRVSAIEQTLDAIFADICEDRRSSYARTGLHTPTWGI